MSALTGHVRYAFTRRQGAASNGAYHLVLNAPLDRGRLHRAAGDALCRPRRTFWGLERRDGEAVTCSRCLVLADRHEVHVEVPA